MSNQLVPRTITRPPESEDVRMPRWLAKRLERVEGGTLLRVAQVRGDSMVAEEKLQETDRLVWQAMTGHAYLDGWANHLAGENPVLMDELRFIKDTGRLAKAGIIADAIDGFRKV